jgi:uncharacterized protein
MTAAPIHLRDERLMLDPAGAAFWPAKRVLIVADLYFEKSPPLAIRGAQPVDTQATLERLNRLIRLYRPAKVLSLGGSFHTRDAASRMAREDLSKIQAMAREASFIWIGSEQGGAPNGLPGVSAAIYREGPFTFRHEAKPQLGPRELEISGHFRPQASIDARARRVSRPCFVTDAHRLMLPAFGTHAGGLDVRDPAIACLFPRGLRVFLLGQEQLFSFAQEQLGRMAEVA